MQTHRILNAILAVACMASAAIAKQPRERQELAPIELDEESDLLPPPVAGKALQDTVWIADWSFDAPGGACTDDGWVKFDNRNQNDGSNYWSISPEFSNEVITGNAAVLRKHDLCWAYDGYGNNWDYSLILKYTGAMTTLSLQFRAETEAGFDFITITAESLGLAETYPDSVIVVPDPTCRGCLYDATGNYVQGSAVGPLVLPDYGPGTHEVHIRFRSDGAVSPEDGLEVFTLGAALVVDDLVVTGGTAFEEDFENALNPNIRLVNSTPITPFGEWARLYRHITDNDKCTENSTCAWLFTDPTRIAVFPDMAFGPGSAVMQNWIDNIIVSPWVSLESTQSASRTILSFRRFPGNRFTQGAIVQNWSVRGRVRIENTDTSALGDSVDCMSPWGHVSMWNSLNTFAWVTSVFDMTAFFDGNARDIQIAFRVSDWRWIAGANPILTLNPGPGPYLDRVRIGRRVMTGPVFEIGLDTRYQAQDNFASVVNSIVPGEHHSPSTDRFGTCDFRMGTELGINGTSSRVISGDSITTNVLDTRLAGGITSVRWFGAIVAGPHAGKAPAPYVVGASGFFETTPDSARSAASGAVVANRWFRDLDDSYFRGGDRLVYYWYATDAGGGSSSAPAGITSPPPSIAAAEVATNGLFEVSYLPEIDWSPGYLARIASDPHGDLAPTAEELAASSQRNCILYYQHVTSNRRSGATNKTSFMRTLDALGFRGDYDVFDPQGYGNTNNQLCTFAAIEQCQGYQLLVEDDGRSNLVPNIPDGTDFDANKVKQATWYRNWLDQGSVTGRATLWILGESTAAATPSNALFTTYCGIGAVVQDQALALNPDVLGQASFTFAPPSCTASFAGDAFSLNGGCSALRNYDGYTPGGTAIATHRYQAGATSGLGAVVMNARPASNANTIVMGFPWFDIHGRSCANPPCPSPAPITPQKVLMSRILACVLSTGCHESLDPTSIPSDDALDAPPVSALHQNVPNPFNPTTTIAFDLAQSGAVRLEVFDVAGRSVRVLVDGVMPAGRGHRATWNGLDATGARVATGLYVYRLAARGFIATRKMILLK